MYFVQSLKALSEQYIESQYSSLPDYWQAYITTVMKLCSAIHNKIKQGHIQRYFDTGIHVWEPKLFW